MDSKIAYLVLLLSMIAGTSTPVTGHPPTQPEHGIAESEFHKLWSRDDDIENKDLSKTEFGETAIGKIANGTDIPLNEPSKVVEDWNSADLHDFPTTTRSTSYHPPDTNLQDGEVFSPSYGYVCDDTINYHFRTIKDAYVEIFTVQPSTHARISPSKDPLYVAGNGTVAGTSDYRLNIPPSKTCTDKDDEGDITWRVSVNWNLNGYSSNTTLLVNSNIEETGDTSHTPKLNYRNLSRKSGNHHTLTLRTSIKANLTARIERCHYTIDDVDCDTNIVWHPTTVVVEDSVEVVDYNLGVSGFFARYPDGDMGLVIYKNYPWQGYSVPSGEVNGVWRFFSMRDPDWDRLVRSTESGKSVIHSPLHPLQMNAFPMNIGATSLEEKETGEYGNQQLITTRHVQILDSYGTVKQSPSLPENVNLDVEPDGYNATYGVVTRTGLNKSLSSDSITVTSHGLVRGENDKVTLDNNGSFAPGHINKSNLTLKVLNSTENKTKVRVILSDSKTGKGISTDGYAGYVVINGEKVNTSGGTVTEVIYNESGAISAKYVPGSWWQRQPGYTGDSASKTLAPPTVKFWNRLWSILVPVSLFLVTVYLVGKTTGWRIWPPWRGL